MGQKKAISLFRAHTLDPAIPQFGRTFLKGGEQRLIHLWRILHPFQQHHSQAHTLFRGHLQNPTAERLFMSADMITKSSHPLPHVKESHAGNVPLSWAGRQDTLNGNTGVRIAAWRGAGEVSAPRIMVTTRTLSLALPVHSASKPMPFTPACLRRVLATCSSKESALPAAASFLRSACT